VARRNPLTRKARGLPVAEISLHMSVAAFLRRAWPAELVWFHVPNGEKRDKATAGKLKGMGVLAGAPDFIFIMPNGQAAFLELKRVDGEFSEQQIEFRDRVLACGCGYASARSPEDAERVLSRWLSKYGLRLRATMLGRAAA
jgi:elongation factor P hydroxylase